MADTRQTDEHARKQSNVSTKLRRRGLVAGAAALVAGVLAQRTAQPVGATHQTEDLGLGQRNPFSGTVNAVTTLEAANGNAGFYVRNNFGAAADGYQDGIQGYAANGLTTGVAGVF